MPCEAPVRCSRCGNKINGDKCIICGKPVVTEKPTLEQFCRSIECDVLDMKDETARRSTFPITGSQEMALEHMKRGYCMRCRAWQYDRFLR